MGLQLLARGACQQQEKLLSMPWSTTGGWRFSLLLIEDFTKHCLPNAYIFKGDILRPASCSVMLCKLGEKKMRTCKTTSGRRGLCTTLAAFCVLCFVLTTISNALVVNVSAYSRTRVVTITIIHVHGLDNMDVDSPPDFYADVYVNGVKKSSGVWDHDNHDVYPNWVQTWFVTYDTTSPNKPVTISIRDKDFSNDDTADVSRRLNKNPCDLVLNMETGIWTGDDRFTGDVAPGYTSGEELPDGSSGHDEDDAQQWFSLTVTG